MADQANFEALMLGLMSENNESRKAAEAQFEALVNFPAQAAPLMCTAMAASQDHTVRSMTTIMFRKRATPEFYAALAPETQVSPPSSSSRANANRTPLHGVANTIASTSLLMVLCAASVIVMLVLCTLVCSNDAGSWLTLTYS